MTLSRAAASESQSLLELRLQLFGKIGLYSGAVAAAGMFAVVLYLLPERVEGYRQTLVAFQLSTENLPWVVTVAGAGLAAASGLIAWLISLYGSFRIAGPVYRFARNLEKVGSVGPLRMQAIREDDCLRQEAEAIQAAADSVREHYQALDRALAAAIDELEAAPSQTVQPDQVLVQVSRIERRVNL